MAKRDSARSDAIPLSPPPPYWHSRLLVGHLEIDADHLKLFAMLSQLHRRAQQGYALPMDDDGPVEFVAELERHQEREEAILAQLGHKKLIEHAHHHRALAVRAAAALAMGCDGDWSLTVHLLTHALLEHVAIEDVALLRFFTAQGCARKQENAYGAHGSPATVRPTPQEMA